MDYKEKLKKCGIKLLTSIILLLGLIQILFGELSIDLSQSYRGCELEYSFLTAAWIKLIEGLDPIIKSKTMEKFFWLSLSFPSALVLLILGLRMKEEHIDILNAALGILILASIFVVYYPQIQFYCGLQ